MAQETNKMLSDLTAQEFFLVADAVIKVNHRIKDKEKRKQLSEAWLKIEHAWYESRSRKNEEVEQ